MCAFALCNNVTPVVDDPDLAKLLDVEENQRKQRATYH